MATLYQRGAAWYLNWSEGGQQFRRSLGSIEAREAERIRSAKEAELTHGVVILPRHQTVGDYLDFYEDWYKAEHPTTHKKLVSELKAFRAEFGRRPIDSLKPREMETWKAERLKGRAPETVGKEVRRVQAAFNRAVEWQEIDTNPAKSVKAPRGARSVAVRFYTAAQVRALRKAPHGPLWRLLAYTGLRRGEAVKVVQSADVVTVGKEKRIRVESVPDETGQGRTKSGEWREIPLTAAALDDLAELPDRIAPVHPDTLGDWFKEDAAAAKVPGTLHRLRHTFCAHLAIAGVPLRRIQLLAGHADYKTTEIYAHLSPTGGKGAVNKLKF